MSIVINKEKLIFSLQTKTTTYSFAIDDKGLLRHLYWGKRLANLDDLEVPTIYEISSNDPPIQITPEEYPVFGGLRYKEHCLKVSFADGVRDIVYQYERYEVSGNTLKVFLCDNHYNFKIVLTYIIYSEENLIERFCMIINDMDQDQKIFVQAVYSGQLHLPHQNLTLTGTHGHWLAELQEFKQGVGKSKIVMESRRGVSTHHHNPMFILDANATEETGDVYFGALKWSGNFKTVIEPTAYGTTLIQMGINPHDTEITLEAGSSFETPSMIFGYTAAGFAQMTHNMHKYSREKLMKPGLRPVLYNSWEAMMFNVNCDEQIKLAKKASALGVELFVVDDGWFGNRHSDADGLGDWYVNKEKFPNGLTPLISAVKDLGMMFGIWIEPEMVNPPTRLASVHPEWIYQFKTRKTDTSRNQIVLNLTLPEVQAFIFNMIDDLLTNNEIDYLKWDVNRPIAQTGISRDMWIHHTVAVYDIVRRIKQKHLNVLIEVCASGGGRVDLGALTYFDDYWTSDNTDPFDRLTIQKTYSYLYPLKAMRAWVTDHPYRDVPLSFKFHSAMLGSLGMGCNILHFTAEQMEQSKTYIEEYKQIRHIIQEGDFYRLQHHSPNDYHLFEFVLQGEVLLFIFLPQAKINRANVRVKLQGLDAEDTYTFDIPKIMITLYGDYLFAAANEENCETRTKSGSFLMNHGLELQLNGDYASAIIKFKKP